MRSMIDSGMIASTVNTAALAVVTFGVLSKGGREAGVAVLLVTTRALARHRLRRP